MKNFKPFFVPILICVILDQAVKIVISSSFMNYNFDIIGDIIRFHPILNTKLSWGGNYITLLSHPIFLLLFNIIVIFVFFSGYLLYRKKKVVNSSCAVKVLMVFGIAGSICSIIDKLFWGGSLDFIELKNFFIFDVKDCYISFFLVIFIALGMQHGKEFSIKEYIYFCFHRFH